MTDLQASIIPSVCNKCGHETDHDVVDQNTVSIELPDGSAADTRYRIVRCRGCGEYTIREEQWYFNYLPDENSRGTLVGITYKPPRVWRRAPSWLNSLQETDPDLVGLLEEVYSVMNDCQVRLLSMGVRTALDHTMTKILGSDLGPFERKLDEMVERGHLTETQRKNLGIVIDAGSASTHRGFKPPRELLEEMVTVMEGVIREHYVTGPMLNTAKTLIPPRPKRTNDL